jgi:hypothetical protein
MDPIFGRRMATKPVRGGGALVVDYSFLKIIEAIVAKKREK